MAGRPALRRTTTGESRARGRVGRRDGDRPLAAVVARLRARWRWRPRPPRRSTRRSDGSPLNDLRQRRGQLQIAFDGARTGEFYTGAADAERRRVSARDPTARRHVHGLRPRRGDVLHARCRPPAVTGDGSAGQPVAAHDYVAATGQPPARSAPRRPGARLRQRDLGRGVPYTLSTPTAPEPCAVPPLRVRRDLFVAGNDQRHRASSPRPAAPGRRQSISARAARPASSRSRRGALPGGAYATFSATRSARAAHRAADFNDTVDPALVDNARGRAMGPRARWRSTRPDRRGRPGASRARPRSILAVLSATQAHGPDGDGQRHGAQRRRQPRCRALGALRDHRRQPEHRRGDDGRRRDGCDLLDAARRSGPTPSPPSSIATATAWRRQHRAAQQTATVTSDRRRRRRCPASRWS